MKDIPFEMLFEIAVKLSFKNVLNLCKTDRQMSTLCNTDYFWREWGKRHTEKNNLIENLPQKVNITVVKRLLLARPNNSSKENAIYTAVWRGNKDVTKLLLDNVKIIRYGLAVQAFEVAVRKGYKDIVKLFLDKEGIEKMNLIVKEKALEAASQTGHYEIAKMLLEKFDYKKYYRREQSIENAQKNKHDNIVKLLREFYS